jgi:ferredoxin
MNADYTERGYLPRIQFAELLSALTVQGYRCVGPVLQNGAITYDILTAVDDLPQGIRVRQEPGSYRIDVGGTERLFDWANGPQALKPLLFTPRERLWRVERSADSRLCFTAEVPDTEPFAVIGVRACDLAALALQDKHFLEGECVDTGYAVRRRGLFLVAVNCSHPAATCFCVSTGDGPAAGTGYDLVLDELDEGFMVSAGSAAGREVLAVLPVLPVTPAQESAAQAARAGAVAMQSRTVPGRDLYGLLFDNLEHSRWADVSARCLSCGNCTAVCPTCFCYREVDELALDGSVTAHAREWDSCFTQGHSYIHGMTIRPDTRLRYRQWLTHKFGSWHEQYGRSGCVGCGRCITWCPVGIDVTVELAALAGTGT